MKKLQSDLLHHYNGEDDHATQGAPRPVGRLKAGLWKETTGAGDQKASKSIAAAAAAQEEQDRKRSVNVQICFLCCRNCVIYSLSDLRGHC